MEVEKNRELKFALRVMGKGTKKLNSSRGDFQKYYGVGKNGRWKFFLVLFYLGDRFRYLRVHIYDKVSSISTIFR